ncbi:hypothetical protein GCM10023166_27860 [Paeniglutamicibacter cryotolerans]
MRPAAIKKHDLAGLEAFSRHYFDMLNHTVQSRDAAPLRALTLKFCVECFSGYINPADVNKAAGTWVTGGEMDLTLGDVRLAGNTSGIVIFSYTQEEMTYFTAPNKSGPFLRATEKPVLGALSAEFDGQWKASSMTYVEDDE